MTFLFLIQVHTTNLNQMPLRLSGKRNVFGYITNLHQHSEVSQVVWMSKFLLKLLYSKLSHSHAVKV